MTTYNGYTVGQQVRSNGTHPLVPLGEVGTVLPPLDTDTHSWGTDLGEVRVQFTGPDAPGPEAMYISEIEPITSKEDAA